MPSVYIQSSVFLPTPSGGAGAVELLVSKMAEGLAKRGWDVMLYGLSGSREIEGGRLVMVLPEGDSEYRERRLVEAMQMAPPPDVIFDHSLHMFAGQRRGPYVAMSHGMAALPSWAHNVVFTSQHHGRLHGRKDPKALLLGIDLADIPPSTAEKREGLFWAGRIMPYKRLHLACEIARLAGMPLTIAGPIVDREYMDGIQRAYAGSLAYRYVGELPRARVLEEMSRARYFLFTSDETEPAGLTMLEAQACGTPVIAVNEWSAKEYINPSETGIIARDVEEAVEGIMEHKRCTEDCFGEVSEKARAWVAERYTSEAMVDRAEEYLRRAIAGERW